MALRHRPVDLHRWGGDYYKLAAVVAAWVVPCGCHHFCLHPVRWRELLRTDGEAAADPADAKQAVQMQRSAAVDA